MTVKQRSAKAFWVNLRKNSKFDWLLRGIVYRLRLQQLFSRLRARQMDRRLEGLVHRADLEQMKTLLNQWRAERPTEHADRD